MIKLQTLLEAIYTDKPDAPDSDLTQQGFKLGRSTVDPVTGAISTDVINLPKFEEIRRQILMMRKEFQPYKFSANEDIAKISKDINTNMTKLSQLIFALDKMIELSRK